MFVFKSINEIVKMRVLVFGSDGMLGRYIVAYLHDKGVWVKNSTRKEYDLSNTNYNNLSVYLSSYVKKGDIVINASGIINKRPDIPSQNYLTHAIKVNSIFPRLCAAICAAKGIKFIHITTDCIYNGSRGCYQITDSCDATDSYGITKACGETSVNDPDCIQIRTSIIGESANGRSLVEWLRSNQNSTITGYTHHLWNGVTCLELAKFIFILIHSPDINKNKVYVFTGEIVSKYELCKLINEIYEFNINILRGVSTQDSHPRNMTLIGNCQPLILLRQQISEMKDFAPTLVKTQKFLDSHLGPKPFTEEKEPKITFQHNGLILHGKYDEPEISYEKDDDD